MAKVIEFYIPGSLTTKVNCIAPNERGKVIEFPSPKKEISLGKGAIADRG